MSPLSSKLVIPCLSIIMTESLPSLLDFEKMLLDRIEDLRGRIHKARMIMSTT
jgi:hypothetical protein